MELAGVKEDEVENNRRQGRGLEDRCLMLRWGEDGAYCTVPSRPCSCRIRKSQWVVDT